MRRRVLRPVGSGLFVVGALLLAFVAYQLWGTSWSEHTAQARLRTQLERQLHPSRAAATGPVHRAAADGSGSDIFGTPDASPSPPSQPAEGEPIGLLSIPRIGMSDDVIIQGVGDDDLRQGPGHYPGTPLPGQPGNSAIAGHRTTYAAPFYNLDQLQVGDPIIVQTVLGTFHYSVSQSEIVTPADTAVLDDTAASELTLTTCNPRYSASQRLVVVALLQRTRATGDLHDTGTSATPRSAAAPVATAASARGGSNDGGGSLGGAVLWGLLTATAAILALLAWRRWRRPLPRWVTGLVGAPVFVVGLFVFYGHLSALLPASF